MLFEKGQGALEAAAVTVADPDRPSTAGAARSFEHCFSSTGAGRQTASARRIE
jgi:hypothetical protein